MAKVYRFDDFVLDSGAFELYCGPTLVPIEPLVFDLLVYLLDHPGVVLSREALMEAVWQGRIVSDTTISTAIKSMRKALGDSGREQKYVRTIHGRGIQFLAPVEEKVHMATVVEPARYPHGREPSVLYIRPVESIGGENLDVVAQTLRVRIGMVLSRMPLLRISSAFAQADLLTDPRDLRTRFEISHVLEVRLQRAEDMLVADAALVETRCGVQIWAQRFDSPDAPVDQEVLLQQLVRRIEPRLMQAMVSELPSSDGETDSRSYLLQAIALLALRGWHQTTFLEAAQMLERAVELEPDFALSHAYLALVKALGHRVGLLRDADTVIPAVLVAVDRTLELESRDSTILGLVGCALADVGQVDRALLILQKSIDADPQNGHAQTALGAALMMTKDYRSAARHLAAGMRASPADSRLAVWGTALALAQLAQGELDSALETATTACREDDRIYLPRVALAAVHLVRKEQSRAIAAVRESVRSKPDLSSHEISCVLGERLGAGVWSIVQTLRCH